MEGDDAWLVIAFEAMGEIVAGMKLTNATGGWVPLSTSAQGEADARVLELVEMCKKVAVGGQLAPASRWVDPENTRQHYVKFTAGPPQDAKPTLVTRGD
jgi:hypothetical protein